MLRGTEALRAILLQPLDYLHPHRDVVPALFDEPAARALLNQTLLRGWSSVAPIRSSSSATHGLIAGSLTGSICPQSPASWGRT
ncbi:hypothetical protein GLGCALEP_04463 [Pseudomonas sp. MM221]|nr:hypothetical protein GLGCALEP_04463 [Pseudomonas sp. MM221]